MRAISDREEAPLERNARRAMMVADRDLRELDDEGKEEKISARRRRGNQRKKDDVILDEAYRILADLVRIKEGEEVRVESVEGVFVHRVYAPDGRDHVLARTR